MNSDAELDALVRRHRRVAPAHAALHFHGAPDSIHGTREFDENAVAGPLHDAAAVLGDVVIEELAPKGVDARQRAFFVGAHQPAIAGNVACKDRRQPAFELAPWPRHPPTTGRRTLTMLGRNGHDEVYLGRASSLSRA